MVIIAALAVMMIGATALAQYACFCRQKELLMKKSQAVSQVNVPWKKW